MQRKEPGWLAWVPVSGHYSLLNRALRGEALLKLAHAFGHLTPETFGPVAALFR